MAKEKMAPWLNYLALTTVILAVCATLSIFKGGWYSTRSVLNQSQVADQWSYYQAKSIKGYLYELQKDELEFELKTLGPKAPKSVVEEYKKKLDFYSQKIETYKKEKSQIEKDARNFETARDDAQRHAEILGIAVIFLQIAILLSSIAALMKKKTIWILGLIVGAAGIAYFVNGFWLFLK